jgi:shikimate kinase
VAKPIVLIAPRGVNTTAVSMLLGEKLHLSVRSPYDYSDVQWAELGFDMTAEVMAFAQGGAYAAYRMKIPLRLRAVERMLREGDDSIIVLPPDFVAYEDAPALAQMTALLADVPQVVLLTPSETAVLLNADLSGTTDWSEVNAYWICNPSNEQLAKHIVYTSGKTETQTRDEILALARKHEPSDIILIGPKLTGKTTIGHLLANALGLPQVSLDDIGRGYLAETDYDRAAAYKVWTEAGVFAWLRFMRPYEAYMVERALHDHHNCIIDFGGGHSVYDDEAHFARVQKVLVPYPNVILILPAPDKDESIAILRKRCEADMASERKLQYLLVTHISYQQLAKQTVYTKDKSVEEMSATVLDALKRV